MACWYSLFRFTRPAWLGLLLAALLFPQGATGQSASVQSLLDTGIQAGADAELMRTVVERANQAGLSPTATADLLRPAVSLAERDLPTRPVLTKALEGLSKRVPPNRMMPVLTQLRSSTEQAGQLVSAWLQKKETQQFIGASESNGPEPSPSPGRSQLIASIADAQEQAVSAETVTAFLNGLPGTTERRPVPLSDVAVAVSVLPDLANDGAASQAAQDLLVAALDAGYDPESMRRLPAAIERAQRQTQRPVTAIAQGAAQAISWGTPAASVLQNLFRGAPAGGLPAQTGEDNLGSDGPPDNDPPGNGPPGNGGPPSSPPGGSGNGGG